MPSPPSPYIWLPSLQRYRDTATGRFVSSPEVRDWGQTSMDDSADHARGMAGALAERDISLGQWERNMREQIKEEYIKQYLLGRGGRDLMTAQDWGSVGGMCADQYRYLDGFAAEIATGELSEKQIAARSEMYLRSAREAFERARGRAQPDVTEIQWSLTSAEHCFPAGTRVLTPSGQVKIEKVKVGDLVSTLWGSQKVTRTYKHQFSGSLTRIEKEGAIVYCTPNHPFLTSSGWVEAQRLRSDQAVLLEDFLNQVKRQVQFPDSDHGVATGCEVFVLGSIPFSLGNLPFSQGFEARMTMPPVSICLDNQFSQSSINYELWLDECERLKVNSEFPKNAKEFSFQTSGFALLKFPMSFHQFCEAFRISFNAFKCSLSEFLACTWLFRGIVTPHTFGYSRINESVSSFFAQFKFKSICLALNLGAGLLEVIRGLVRPHFSIMTFEKCCFFLSPSRLLKPRIMLEAKFRSPIHVVVSTSRTFLTQRFSSSPTIMGIATSNRAKPVAFLQNWITTKLTFLHPSNPPPKLYSTSKKSQVVYNLEVENAHHYIANGFVVHNCDDCVGYADMGWQSIADDPYEGNLPGSGGTRCLTNCACFTTSR